MELADIVAFTQRFWVVWLLVLFVGILTWVFWPGRKQEWEERGLIPLEDDLPDGDRQAMREARGHKGRDGIAGKGG